ncbi:MAG TPA: 3-phosphoshikimate 1-carboxyvinyltransferase [Phycisphaerales bacterium]|nr:3-phosphoshikimate 1-carboxyvinyltransferase [Phycisphaerales bacterium]
MGGLDDFRAMLRLPLDQLPDPLPLRPVEQPFDVTVTPPGSKSIANRVLLLAGLARGISIVRNVPRGADDVEVMVAALRSLGVVIDEEAGDAGVLRITGVHGKPRGGVTLDLHNAGTATRFLTAAVCLADAPVVIDGSARMRQRPLGELIGMLRARGAEIEELGAEGCVPIRVQPSKLVGGEVRIGRTQSSQFVSALCLIGPFLKGGLTFRFEQGMTSPSYIDMTLAILRGWVGGGGVAGGSVRGEATIDETEVRGREWTIEPDASGATYFWAAGAVCARSRCVVPGLTNESVQGDARFIEVLGRMGAGLRGGVFDLSLMPDAAMTLAAVACFAEGTTEIYGLRTLRVKETDRIAALVAELSKIGVRAEAFLYTDENGLTDEGLRVMPPVGGVDCSASAPAVTFETYDDHRMAMSMAIIGLRRPNVLIRNPRCVEKTYPGFWGDWAMLYT